MAHYAISIIVLLCTFATFTFAVEHNIGPWVLGKQAEYKAWSQKETFIVGDTLKFVYNEGTHNVWELASQKEYDECDISNPIRTYNKANAVVPLTTVGKHFYVCGVGYHCNRGMKVTINVIDTGAYSPAPAPEYYSIIPGISPAAAAPAPEYYSIIPGISPAAATPAPEYYSIIPAAPAPEYYSIIPGSPAISPKYPLPPAPESSPPAAAAPAPYGFVKVNN